jgi:hypothetical protein
MVPRTEPLSGIKGEPLRESRRTRAGQERTDPRSTRLTQAWIRPPRSPIPSNRGGGGGPVRSGRPAIRRPSRAPADRRETARSATSGGKAEIVALVAVLTAGARIEHPGWLRRIPCVMHAAISVGPEPSTCPEARLARWASRDQEIAADPVAAEADPSSRLASSSCRSNSTGVNRGVVL